MQNNELAYLDKLYSLQLAAAAISDAMEFLRSSRVVIQQIIPHAYFFIFFHDKSRECLTASFVYNVLPSPTEEEISISYQNPLIKDILISRQTFIRQRPHILLPEENIFSELFTPILTPEEVIGCLYFARTEEMPFTSTEIRLAEMCAFIMALPMSRILWEKRAQQTHEILNEFREKYLSILDAIPLPAVIIDSLNDRFQEVNRAFLEWTGYDRRQVFSANASKFFSFVEDFFPMVDTWPPRPYKARIYWPNGETVESTAFSSWLTTQSPEKRIIIFHNIDSLNGHAHLQSQVDQIIDTLSQNLKTPLQNLKGFAALLQEEYRALLSEPAASYIQRILINAEQMEKLVMDLLTYSRLHVEENNFVETESAHIIKLSLDALSGLLEKKPVNIIIDANMPTITCNPAQMTLVFTNLISNALNYNRRSEVPNIEIGCKEFEGEHEFYIKDNGCSQAAKNLSNIFDFSTSREGNQGDNGNGIGLAIAKRIIEQHHGRVWAESCPEGGTVIKFTLPRVLHKQLILA